MRRTTLTLVIAVALTLLSAIFVVAQSNQLNLLQPAVVNVTQAVPVNVTLGGIVDGKIVTLTAPMTMNVALQVRLEGRVATVTAAGQAAPAAAASSDAVYNDTRGLPYRADAPAPFQLTQLTSAASSSSETFQVLGEIKNNGQAPMKFVKAIVTMYRQGKIVNVGETYTLLDTLAPGQSSPFQLMTMVKASDVDAYTVQVQGRPAN